MDELLIEIAKQVPALLVMAWIVQKFLKVLSKQGEDFASSLRENTKAIADLRVAIVKGGMNGRPSPG